MGLEISLKSVFALEFFRGITEGEIKSLVRASQVSELVDVFARFKVVKPAELTHEESQRQA